MSLQYGVFALANGTTALLPLYVYDGTVAGDGGGYQVSFRVVPVEPSYLDLATVQGPIRYERLLGWVRGRVLVVGGFGGGRHLGRR